MRFRKFENHKQNGALVWEYFHDFCFLKSLNDLVRSHWLNSCNEKQESKTWKNGLNKEFTP